MNAANSSGEAASGPCPECGLSYVRGLPGNERIHRRVHDRTLNGHPTKLCGGFYAITHQSSMQLQRLAEAAAREAQEQTKYDITSFAAAKKKFDEYDTIVMLYVRRGRVRGLLVSRNRECENTANLDSFRSDGERYAPCEITQVSPHTRRALDMIWVLKKNRRQGVAKALIRALAKHCKMRAEDFAHMTPFTDDALELWKALEFETIYVV